MIEDFKKPEPKPRVTLDSSEEQASAQPAFRTPEEVAGSGNTFGSAPYSAEPPAPTTLDDADGDHTLPEHADGGKRAKGPGKTVRLFGKWPVSRKKLIIIIILIVVLLAGGATAFALTRKSAPAPVKKPVVKATVVVPPAPKPITSPLTGNTVTADQSKYPVIGAMIENSSDARPQSGLKDAGVVYEAIAEAGITRFLALYQEARPGNIGPIRSSRPYYLDWAMAFDASYAHVGGSPDALARIKSINVKDMDQFFNPSAYHRITTRYAPHNVYTSVQQLVDLAASKGWTSSSFTPFARKADTPYKTPETTTTTVNGKPVTTPKVGSETRPPANSIDFSISSEFYSVHYDYDATTNLYKRNEGGAPHMDADSNTQLTPKVVIALVMPYSLMSDGYHSQYNTQGSGKMYVFQDGTVTTGTWTKGEPQSQFEFKTDAGKPIALDAGQTWISVVADAGKVTYK